MSVERVLLGGCGNPNLIPIPTSCQQSKTIYIPITKDRLFLRKDTTGPARDYFLQVIHTLLTKNWTPEKALQWFYGLPDYSWLEFDIHRKLLYLCSLKK